MNHNSALHRYLKKRRIIIILHDTAMALFSFFLAHYLRLGEVFFDSSSKMIIESGLLFIACALIANFITGLPLSLWRFVSLPELKKIFQSVSLTILLYIPLAFLWNRLDSYPRSVMVIHWLLLMAGLAGSRILYRLYRERKQQVHMRPLADNLMPILVIGISHLSETFIREVKRFGVSNYQIIGLIALPHELDKVGSHIHGIPILNTLDHLDQTIQSLQAKDIAIDKCVVTSDDIHGQRLRELISLAESHNIQMARLPKLTQLQKEKHFSNALQPIAVEDILGRSPNTIDFAKLANFIDGKTVLVTGAGGTIGGELVNQILKLKPKKICLLDHSELALYNISQTSIALETEIDTALLSVRDKDGIEQLIKTTMPDIIFHAAALKHVPIVEAHPLEGLLTNVIGTQNLADAAAKYNIDHFVMISTDKAINPTNVMGATKRLAELYIQALSLDKKVATKFITVRFGNVLGSNGSVVPLFQKQIAAGGPITVTDPEITRYFMTTREAVGLVMQAASQHSDTNSGKVYVLDMGEPMKIVELAEQMIRLADLTPYKDIDIEFIGLRPGEKLYEELFYDSEDFSKTDHASIFIAQPRTIALKDIKAGLKSIQKACINGDKATSLSILKDLVQSFSPSFSNTINMIKENS